jgi:hypothetical protein
LSEQATLNRKVFRHWGTTLGQGSVSTGLTEVVEVVKATSEVVPGADDTGWTVDRILVDSSVGLVLD